jgi:hypothetical protein
MFNLGASELVLIAVVVIPSVALVAAPIVVAVVLWKRQTELRARVERLEAALSRRGGDPA